MFKTIVLLFISVIPINFLRVFLYKFFYNYNIDKNSKIGIFSIINCNELKISNSIIQSFTVIKVKNCDIFGSKIGKFNKLINFNKLLVEEGSCFGIFNKVIGEPKIATDTSFIVRRSVSIKNCNYFDLTANIVVGDKVKIDSFCQFWTHSYKSDRKLASGDIIINSNSIINNSCLISNNVTIGKGAIVGHGSVVIKNLENNKHYYHGLYRK
jgi:acetyltransferase-like isoleucine patch superfamily enzyme